jgi:tyrosinase
VSTVTMFVLSALLLFGHCSVLAIRTADFAPENKAVLEVDELAEKALSNLKSYSKVSSSPGGCTVENAIKRKEWYENFLDIFQRSDQNRGDLSKVERKEYIDAVLCVSKKPSQGPVKEFPGLRTRYDDFVAVHINQTMLIHGTVRFSPR